MGGYPRGFCQNTRQTPRETCWCSNRTAPGPTKSPSSGDRARSILAANEGAMTSTTITPIEIDGQFYVSVILDGHENGTDRTPTLKQLKPWRHGLPGSAAACFTSRSRSVSCGSRQPTEPDMEIRQWAKSSTCIASWRTSRMTN